MFAKWLNAYSMLSLQSYEGMLKDTSQGLSSHILLADPADIPAAHQ